MQHSVNPRGSNILSYILSWQWIRLYLWIIAVRTLGTGQLCCLELYFCCPVHHRLPVTGPATHHASELRLFTQEIHFLIKFSFSEKEYKSSLQICIRKCQKTDEFTNSRPWISNYCLSCKLVPKKTHRVIRSCFHLMLKVAVVQKCLRDNIVWWESELGWWNDFKGVRYTQWVEQASVS